MIGQLKHIAQDKEMTRMKVRSVNVSGRFVVQGQLILCVQRDGFSCSIGGMITDNVNTYKIIGFCFAAKKPEIIPLKAEKVR